MESSNRKKVKGWVYNTQPSCPFVNWVKETLCCKKAVCNNPDNTTGKCAYRYCPKVLNSKH